VSLTEALIWIANRGTRIFCVEFVSRTNSELRRMAAQLKVRKFLKNGVPAYDPSEKGLIWCYDTQKKAYRSIAVEGIRRLLVDGAWVEVTQPQDSKGE
jgi:hypothetical protein